MPLPMSVFSAMPVYIVIIETVITRMPGSSCCRYSRGEPASAPPNRYVNSSANMIGNAVTSNSCIGTCLILSIARQPKVTDAASARRARRAGCGSTSAERSVASARTRVSVMVVPVIGGSCGTPPRWSSSAGWPVRARNTSSRLGWPRANSATPMPAAGQLGQGGGDPLGVGDAVPRARPGRPRAAPARRAPRCSDAARPRCRWLGIDAGARAARPSRPSALSSPLVPSAMTLPWSMMAMRSASWSASSRYCVVSSTVVPSATSTRTISHTWLRLRGSRPVVGSSRNSSSGVTTMLAAMSRRRRMPPEYVLHQAVGGVGQPEGVEQLVGPLLGRPARRSRAGGRAARGSRGRSAPRRPRRTGR